MENTITIQREEHSRYVYVCGTSPLFSVGDVLAIYEFYHDYEGEMVLGKVKNISFDEDYDDWLYELDDGDFYCENTLLEDEAYRKKNVK